MLGFHVLCQANPVIQSFSPILVLLTQEDFCTLLMNSRMKVRTRLTHSSGTAGGSTRLAQLGDPLGCWSPLISNEACPLAPLVLRLGQHSSREEKHYFARIYMVTHLPPFALSLSLGVFLELISTGASFGS